MLTDIPVFSPLPGMLTIVRVGIMRSFALFTSFAVEPANSQSVVPPAFWRETEEIT